jgi:hypothetical protein
MCECCCTCDTASPDKDGNLYCPDKGEYVEYESSWCINWTPNKQGIADCDAGPCETCEVRAWWDRKAEWWKQRLA